MLKVWSTSIVLFAIGLACAGCASTGPSVGQELQEAMRRDQDARAMMATNEADLLEAEVRINTLVEGAKTSGTPCSHQRWEQAISLADAMSFIPRTWELASSSPIYISSLRRDALLTAVRANRAVLNMRFKIADGALSARCFDIADAQYRSIVQTYIGTAFAAQRERARLGIDDINRLRARS